MNDHRSIIISWPPDYTVKQHPRARHVKLKASRQQGLQVIVPTRFNQNDIPIILEKHKAWIEKQLHKLALSLEPASDDNLPTQLKLTALNQTWDIQYIASNNRLRIISRPHQEIALLGKIDNKPGCKKLLANWVKEKAQQYLSTVLQAISNELGLPYQELTLRDQKTRWGSCSHAKSINLNYKLIFFPPEWVRHILIHELCHTVHLNHSVKFWRLVARFDPLWQEHRRLMRKAREMIPHWIA